jgi:oligoendopeptidase F
MKLKKSIAVWIPAMAAAGLILAAAEQERVPDYSQTERKDIPRQFTWSIEDIYPSIAAWEQDCQLLREMIERVPDAARDWTATPADMLAMWRLRDDLYQKIFRLYSYAMHQNNVELSDDRFARKFGEARTLLAMVSARLSFMKSDVRQMGADRVSAYLAREPRLAPYRFSMEEAVRMGKHLLPQPQQEIIRGSEAYADTFRVAAGILNNLEMPKPELALADGTKVRVDYSTYAKYRDSDNRADRESVIRTFWENRNGFLATLAALLDGEMKKQHFYAKAQGYGDCLEAALDQDAIDTAVFHTMIEQVRGNLAPLHRYLELKKKLLRADSLRYSELHRSPFPAVDRIYSYAQTQRIIREALRPLGPEYSAMVRDAFQQRWIDVYPNRNKQPSAYSANLYGVHPFIKLNFDGRLASINNLVHELGHAAYGEFSARFQPFSDADPVLFLDEIASTLNENLLLRHLLQREKDDLIRLHLIDTFLKRPVRIALYGQAQLSEFELAAHRMVEEGGTLTATWLNGKYLELLRSYHGQDRGIVEVEDFSRGEWSWIPQLFRNYYVYTYATGLISSMKLAKDILEGSPGARTRYLEMLKAGGSDHPLTLLKRAGVDLRDPAVYREAFQYVDDLVSEMERIAARSVRN